MDIKCTNNKPFDSEKKLYPDLTLGNIYFVMGIEGDYYRVIGDLGRPYLYHKSRFEVTDSLPDPEWIKTVDESIGDIYYPEELVDGKLFKDYFSCENAGGKIYFYAQRIQERRTSEIYDEELVNKLYTPLSEVGPSETYP